MNTQFKTLFTVGVRHGYYEETCRDIRYLVPGATARDLRKGRLLARIHDGELRVLFELDGRGVPLAAISKGILRFGLVSTNVCFANFTQLNAGFPDIKLLYRNSASTTALDAPKGIRLVGRMISHEVTAPDRPVTLTLKDGLGTALWTDVITPEESRTSISYDLTGRPPGSYVVEEATAGGTGQIAYYSEPELAQAGVLGILEIRVSPNLYATPASFEVRFAARFETLNYYIVATAKDAGDLAPLSITDAGAADDNRDTVSFTKISSASFTNAELSPALLGDSSKQVVLFRSAAQVPRMEKARSKIQLLKNSEILIPNLPPPGAGQSNADIIVPILKL